MNDLLSVLNNKIPRKDRNLSIKDVVCGLHFKDDFFKYECKMPDGSIKYIERIRAALRENAIPIIFFGLCFSLINRKNNKEKVKVVVTQKRNRESFFTLCVFDYIYYKFE
ncbi:Uncharacterized protein FWK35_00020717 [Aphis craccivora]|uniref:THAP-type domain-containing protein n=1 Tax=Aphis craccivora TaxID=307492 RepID=A0A6G0XRU8_APHCR|nr:Uncharacterized protein FWK35_00020717 [Aphis craccivora]